MSRLVVKICGVRRGSDLEAALEAGADHVGLNFVARSRRRVSVDLAEALAATLPDGVAIGVFEDTDAQTILDTCARAGITTAQVHGALAPADAARLAAHLDLVVAHPGAAGRQRLAPLVPHAAAFLLDGRTPGSGQPWAGAPMGARVFGRPAWLAGGLTPETVAQALLHHQPAGVDVASGVEGPDGQIDADRVRAFVRGARLAHQRAQRAPASTGVHP